MKITPLAFAAAALLAPTALAAGPLEPEGAIPLQSSLAGITATFAVAPTPCTATGAPMTIRVQNRSANAFTGSIVSPEDPHSGGPISVSANGEGSFAVKPAFACERTPSLSKIHASVKLGSGQTVASRSFRLAGYEYPTATGRPPTAGQINTASATSVKLTQMTCGQPVWIDVTLVGSATTTRGATVYATLEFTGAAASNAELKSTVYLEPNVPATTRLVGPALDCAIATPIVRLKGVYGQAQLGGAADGTPIHATSVSWVDEAAH